MNAAIFRTFVIGTLGLGLVGLSGFAAAQRGHRSEGRSSGRSYSRAGGGHDYRGGDYRRGGYYRGGGGVDFDFGFGGPVYGGPVYVDPYYDYPYYAPAYAGPGFSAEIGIGGGYGGHYYRGDGYSHDRGYSRGGGSYSHGGHSRGGRR